MEDSQIPYPTYCWKDKISFIEQRPPSGGKQPKSQKIRKIWRHKSHWYVLKAGVKKYGITPSLGASVSVYTMLLSVCICEQEERPERRHGARGGNTPHAKLTTRPYDSDMLCTPLQKLTRTWQESQTTLTKHVFVLQFLPLSPLLKFLQLLS